MAKTPRLLLYVFYILVTGGVLLAAWRAVDPRGKPVSGEITDGALILRSNEFRAPDSSPEQTYSLSREALSIVVLPDQPPPTPAERGVRILLAKERAALINDRAVTVEVRYALPAGSPASGLAVSLQGIAPAEWISHEFTDAEGVAQYALPAQFADVNAIGLRALSDAEGQSGAVNIREIRILPGAPELAER